MSNENNYNSNKENLITDDDFVPQARSTNYKSKQNQNNFKNTNTNNITNPLIVSNGSFISKNNNLTNTIISNNNNNINFIPCINCNNIINIDDIGKK